MEEEIVYSALNRLHEDQSLTCVFIPGEGQTHRAKLHLTFGQKTEIFTLEVKKELRQNHVWQQNDDDARIEKFMVIAEVISAQTRKVLREQGTNYLDGNGNIFVSTQALHIWIERPRSRTNEKSDKKSHRALSTDGLKAIFHFLVDPAILTKTQRTIAKSTGLSLGSVNSIIKSLVSLQYLIATPSGYQLINKERLIEKWVEYYGSRLKPKIFIGSYRLANADSYSDWTRLKLHAQKSFWGGEAAAALLTFYLQPEFLSLYTVEAQSDLLLNYHLTPDPKGTVLVYKKFWTSEISFNDYVVHPLLIYAELLDSNDSRCIEVAKFVFEKYIRDTL